MVNICIQPTQLRAEHDEMKVQLDRKERECEAKVQEKEDLMRTLNILKGKLDSESKDHKTTEVKLTEMTQHAETLRKAVSLFQYCYNNHFA